MFKKLESSERIGLFIIAATVIFIASQLTIAWILGPDLYTLADLQLSFRPNFFYEILGNLSEQSISRLLDHFYLDFFHPFFYGTALYLMLAFFRQHLKFPRHFIFLPFIASFADFFENIAELFIILEINTRHDEIFYVASGFSFLKWITVLICLLQLTFYSILFLRMKIRD